MPKRRRLFTPLKYRSKNTILNKTIGASEEVTTARGRLKGALLEVLDPASDDSDTSSEFPRTKRHSKSSYDEDDWSKLSRPSYVLKLFDRSVDLSQFKENSPLYPICRAWIANQPKANYKNFRKTQDEPPPTADSVELPGPEGPPVSKIPPLLPEQLRADKNNINLNYREAPPPSREQLLRGHCQRWAGVRGAWLRQAARAETRYDAAQQLLNKINITSM